MSTARDSILFDPAPDLASRAIDLLVSVDLTFREIAEQFNTTAEALAAWISRPDIADRLDTIESAGCRRTRLVATNCLPPVVEVVARIITEFAAAERRRPAIPNNPTNLHALELRRRVQETARRACSLITRLTRIAPRPASTRDSSPKGCTPGAGGGARSLRRAIPPESDTAPRHTEGVLVPQDVPTGHSAPSDHPTPVAPSPPSTVGRRPSPVVFPLDTFPPDTFPLDDALRNFLLQPDLTPDQMWAKAVELVEAGERLQPSHAAAATPRTLSQLDFAAPHTPETG